MDFLKRAVEAHLCNVTRDPDEAKHRPEYIVCRDNPEVLSVLVASVRRRFDADVEDGEIRNHAGEDEMAAWCKKTWADWRSRAILLGVGES
jgi:hypothetical protein